MKKKYLFLAIALLLSACSGEKPTTPQIEPTNGGNPTPTSQIPSSIPSPTNSQEATFGPTPSSTGESFPTQEPPVPTLIPTADTPSEPPAPTYNTTVPSNFSPTPTIEITPTGTPAIPTQEPPVPTLIPTVSPTPSEVEITPTPSEIELTNPMNEPYVARQYYLNHIGDIYGAWQKYRGRGITVAVIDVGFNPDHEEFFDMDGNSKISAKSASFTTKSNKTTTEVGIDKVVNMGESHGTFCAGIVGASINNKGVVGIAPEAELMLLKTDAKPKSIAQAFYYAADNGAKVITISIGSYYNYEGDLQDDNSDLAVVFNDSVQYCYNKGVVVCSAGGNGGLDNQPTEYTFPACVDHVIGVGGLAANSSSEIWDGSSYNSSPQYQFIDVLAPSEMMFGCCHYDNKIYDSGWNGTSFASPIVAGIAALYFEKNPNNSAADFEKDLYDTCHKITTSQIANTNQLGYGRVDVGALLEIEPQEVEIKIKTNWNNNYAYVWNSITNNQQSSWPGNKLEKIDGTCILNIDTKNYDSIIFSNGNGQTIDISITSFLYANTYDLTKTVNENGKLIGNYI